MSISQGSNFCTDNAVVREFLKAQEGGYTLPNCNPPVIQSVCTPGEVKPYKTWTLGEYGQCTDTSIKCAADGSEWDINGHIGSGCCQNCHIDTNCRECK
jgi:hypothetical protein